MKGVNNIPVKNVSVSGKEFHQMKELAEEYLTLLAVTH
jgi:hypothetical protein